MRLFGKCQTEGMVNRHIYLSGRRDAETLAAGMKTDEEDTEKIKTLQPHHSSLSGGSGGRGGGQPGNEGREGRQCGANRCSHLNPAFSPNKGLYRSLFSWPDVA